MTNIVLLDTSYIFHRVTACKTWCNKSGNIFDDEAIYNNFCSSIKKLEKKVGVPIENMILCRDSPVKNLWRKHIYGQYKQKRTYSEYGPYIKELYKKIQKLFNVVLRIEKAEADDIIAVLTFFYLGQNKKNNIYIVSNDKDFFQLPKLFSTSRVHILDNTKFKEKDLSKFSLEEKIIKGDPSDNIKALRKNYDMLDYLHNKQLIDLSYIPRFIQDSIFLTDYFPLGPNTRPLPIQLGFACMNMELREKSIFCSRTCRLKTIIEKGPEYAKELALQNADDLISHIEWNHENGIRFMRISSELMPHYSNPRAPKYTFGFIRSRLKKAGNLARLYKQRLTFHPGQFNILSSPREEVFEHTFQELKWHADVLDIMGMDQDSVMIIHGGGIYDSKEKAIERFVSNFHRLDENIKRRLVLENCERCYNIEDVLRISEEVNIPIVFDTHHYTCYNQGACKREYKKIKEARYYIPRILETWKRRGIKPKFHISEQKPKCRIGSHSDFVECIPDYLLEIPEKYGIDIDIMIEAKMKEKSVFRLYQNYPELFPF